MTVVWLRYDGPDDGSGRPARRCRTDDGSLRPNNHRQYLSEWSEAGLSVVVINNGTRPNWHATCIAKRTKRKKICNSYLFEILAHTSRSRHHARLFTVHPCVACPALSRSKRRRAADSIPGHVVARLTYATSAWWGFTTSDDRRRLEGFLRRGIRAGLYSPSSPTVETGGRHWRWTFPPCFIQC